jgi:hypothetical protein
VGALCGMFMIPLPILNDDKKLDVHWRCLKALLVKGGIDDPGTHQRFGTVARYVCELEEGSCPSPFSGAHRRQVDAGQRDGHPGKLRWQSGVLWTPHDSHGRCFPHTGTSIPDTAVLTFC